MDIHSRIAAFTDAGNPFCVVVVLSAEGSTPREVGVKAIVDSEGRILGTVGGGAVEAEAQRAAIDACRSGQPALIEIEMSGDASTVEPICGGKMRILVDPTARKDAAAYSAAAATALTGRQGLLLTVVRCGARVETQVSWLPEPEATGGGWAYPLVDVETARTCLSDGTARLVTGKAATQGGQVYVLVEPVSPGPRLLVAGGGHIGQALAAQAMLVGFSVTVIDDRPEFASPSRFEEGVETHCGDIAEALAECHTDGDTYIVIVTRGHRQDADALRACIHKPVAYIGMIGSRRKVELIKRNFADSGIATKEELDAVHAPIGLDIGAETVPEIATSILAEMIAVRRKCRVDRCPAAMRDQ